MTAHQPLILAINAGSSSLKLGIFTANNQLYTASFSDLSTDEPSFSFSSKDGSPEHSDVTAAEGKDHPSAFDYFLRYLKQSDIDANRIVAIGHRVVHGGMMDSPTRISEETIHHLEELSDLAPLHNGPALKVIETCISSLPSATSYALFDTSFHHTIPPHIYSYAIDPKIAKSKGLRKYGFHGLSYSYILHTLSSHLTLPTSSQNFIILHLGSGASICAIKHGKSLDTTMGLTPLDGLPGSSRSGSVDPSLIFHYTSQAGKIEHSSTGKMHITEAEDILNKQSGWKALTGTSDFGKIISSLPSSSSSITSSPSSPSPELSKYELAYNLFLDRILSFLGSYILKLGGPPSITALVFSGGIGENSARLRKDVIDACTCIGVDPTNSSTNDSVSSQKEKGKSVIKISSSSEGAGGIPSFVCFTDEQSEMVKILLEAGVINDDK